MKTTNRELSKALKEAGAKQESDAFWIKRTLISGPTIMQKSDGDYRYEILIAASFDCSELLNRIPDEYIADADETDVELLGKLYLWCLQNGHCKE